MVVRIRCMLVGWLLVFLLGAFVGCSDPEARYQEQMAEARALVEAGEYDRALDLLNPLAEQYPERAEILTVIGEAQEESGNAFFAGLFYERAANEDPEYAELLFDAAKLFADEGESAKALAAVNEYLEYFPDDAEAWRFSADLLARENRVQSALSAHLRAERQDGPSRNPEYAAEMGRLYLVAGNPAQADVYFRTAAEEAPESRLPALLGRLTVAYRAEEFARAEELIDILDEEFPGAVEASALATAREQVKMWRVTQDAIAEELARLEAAENEAEETAAEEETEAEEDATGQAGEAVADEGSESGEPAVADGGDEVTSAEGKLAGATATKEEPPPPPPPPPQPPPPPPPPPTAAELAEEALDAGNAEEATRLYWRAVRTEGDNPEIWAGLSRASLQSGDPETAEIAILEALRREPDSLQFTLTYLDVIQQSRSQTRFMEELEKAYEEIPNSPDIVLSMARAYAQPGRNPANAAYFYRKFLEMAPTHPEVATARRELNALP